MDTTIVDLREKIADRLRATDSFDGVPVLTHKTGDLQAKITAAVNKLKVCAVVWIESAREKGNQTLKPTYDVRFAVLVVENPTLNKSGNDAWSLALAAVAELKLLPTQSPNGLIETVDEDIAEVTPPENAGLLVVRVPLFATIAGIPRSTTN